MDLSEGFQTDEPEAFVRWGMTESELLATLPASPEHVIDGGQGEHF